MNQDIREIYNFEFVGGRLCLDFTNTVSNYDADRGNERFKSYPALVAWGDVVGAVSPYSTPATAAKKFYRLRYH